MTYAPGIDLTQYPRGNVILRYNYLIVVVVVDETLILST